MYGNDATASKEVHLPVEDAAPEVPPFYPEDLDMDRIFPVGSYSTRVSVVPGTSCALDHHYRIFVSRDDVTSLLNRSVALTFDKPWYGNIVVTKHAARDKDKLIHVTSGEKDLIDVIVGA